MNEFEIYETPTLFESFELLMNLLKNKVQYHISRMEIVDYITDL